MAKPRILTVSSANIDLIANMNKLPSAGQTVTEYGNYEYTPGGKGANCAHAVHKLGGDSVFCAKLGSDTHGARLSGIFRDNGIDTCYVSVDKRNRTGMAIVMVEANGVNRIVVYPGANKALTPVDAEEAMTCYPDAVIVQFEVPMETVLATTYFARTNNIPIFVDAGPAIKDFPLEELGPVEVFSPNETEAYIYTGIRPDTTQNCLKVCMELANRVQAKYYILKLGGRGVFYYDGTYYKVIAPYNVDVVDTTAAGDVFTGALALEYIRSYDIRRACEYANIAGALTVSKEGSFYSVPSHNDIADYVAKHELKFEV